MGKYNNREVAIDTGYGVLRVGYAGHIELLKYLGNDFSIRGVDEYIRVVRKLHVFGTQHPVFVGGGEYITCEGSNNAVPQFMVSAPLIDADHIVIWTRRRFTTDDIRLRIFYREGDLWKDDDDCTHIPGLANFATILELENLI